MKQRPLPVARLHSLRSDASRWCANNWKLLLIVLVIATGGFGIYSGVKWVCGAEYRQGRVEKKVWQHRTNLRERSEYRDGDWGSAPSRAGYYREPTWGHKCYDKEDGSYCCMSNTDGTCAMWCTDYSRWCDYSYYDWPIREFKEIEGEGEQTSWETYGDRLDETHRETREGWYHIYFTNTQKTWKYTTRDFASFCKFTVGDLWELEFPNVGSMRPTKKTVLEAQ